MTESASSSGPTTAVEEIIGCFKSSLITGKNWYLALLEAVKNWPVSEEHFDGKDYHYIIHDEALDLLQIAERLLTAAGELVPEDEKISFLFRNKTPLQLNKEEVRELMGEQCLGQHLNFFYGIVVEEAIIQAVEEAVRKEEQGLNMRNETAIIDEAYNRVYEASQRTLLRKFRNDMVYGTSRKMTLKQLKEFSYWRFKYRLKHCDKARIASDTKKALSWLQHNSDKPSESP
ncbi:MAG: hypothetical protein FWE97_02725 [Dehalococcoidia bacterium]|nr:hypothetical protein [Dehalococcoidia bacterium]